MSVAALLSQLYVLDQHGPVEPTNLQGPVRQGLGKYGDGLSVEEGTTNLFLNPSFEAGVGGVNPAGNAPSFAVNAARSFSGTQCMRVTWATGSGGAGAGYQTVTVPTGVHAISIRVFLQPGQPSVTIYLGTGSATFTTTTAATPTSVTGQWVTLTAVINVTVAGTITPGITHQIPAVAGNFVDTDGWQAETKSYATSFCSGDLATAWNAPGNLLPAAAQSFEDGTTGGWTAVGSTSIGNTATTPYVGTKALSVAATATNGGAAQSPAVAVTPGKTYTGSAEVRHQASTPRPVALRLDWYTAQGAFISSSTGSSITTTVANYLKVTVTGAAPATAASCFLVLSMTGAATSDADVWDAFRVEEGTGAASYAWTGAENASTSTRTASTVTHASPTTVTTSAVTLCAFFVVGQNGTAVTAVHPASLGSGSPILALRVGIGGAGSGVSAYNGTTALTPGPGPSFSTGDSGFIAATWDGATVTVYVSKNGGAIVSNSYALALAGTAFGSLFVGSGAANGLGGAMNGTVEQALVYNAVLSAAEVAAIAFSTSETAYKDDPRIVLAEATGSVRGTVQANTAAGTGRYRSARSVLSSLEQITTTGANPDDDIATHKITVPAGSGIGQGQVVAFTPDGTLGTRFQVTRAFSPGGALDELLAIPA